MAISPCPAPAARSGPRPLRLHLLTATTSLTSSSAAFQLWKSGSGPSNRANPAAARLLAELGNLADQDLQSLQIEVDNEVRRRLDAFHRGVLAYRQHPYRRDLSDPPVVWQRGTTRLLDFGGQGRPALFVPSLVNRAYVLDLAERSSLLRWMRERGIRPLLIDWGAPGEAEGQFDLTSYVSQRLVPALAWANEQAGGAVPVVGYCMGGLLAVALAVVAPERVSALGLLATPWDFHAANHHQALALAAAARFWEPVLATTGMLPVDAIQSLFWSLDPFLVLQKFVKFAGMGASSGSATAFVALEDWLNDGVPLAAPVARECLIGWYGENSPATGQWRIDGTVIDPGRVRCRSFVAVSETDRIVPVQSAQGLARDLPNADVFASPLGHIGMVVSRSAQDTVWPALAEWLTA